MPPRKEEVLYAKLRKLGVNIDRLKQIQPTVMQLEDLLGGLLRMRDRKLVRFVSQLIENRSGH